MAIIVVGMHKSGMRAVASVLQSLGANWASNPEGRLHGWTTAFEGSNSKSASIISETFLNQNDLNCLTIPLINSRPTLAGVEEYTQSIAKMFGASDPQRPQCFSDPMLSFLLPYWRAANKRISAIICVRRPDIVSLSLSQHYGISTDHAAALWELYTLAALHNTRRMPCSVVVYEELLAKPEAVIKKLFSEIPELSRVGPSPDAFKVAVSRVRRSSDLRGFDKKKATLSTAVELYDRLADGDINGARKHTPTSLALELVRLEADLRLTKRVVAEAREQVGHARKQETAQRETFARHYERLKNIAGLIADTGQVAPADTNALLDRLDEAVRSIETPEAITRRKTESAMLLEIKDERIEWLRQELEATSARAESALDKSLTLELEVQRLRAERDQQVRAKNDSLAENILLTSALHASQDQLSRSDEDRRRLQNECARLEAERELTLAKAFAVHETKVAEMERRREQADEERNSLLAKYKSELLESSLTIAKLQEELADRETLNAAFAQTTPMSEQRDEELIKSAAQQVGLTDEINRLSVEINRLQRELQESRHNEADLALRLQARDLSESVFRATVSQQEAIASALQTQLTLARENADHLTKQLARRVELIAQNEARHMSDRRMLAEYSARVPLLEAIAAESPRLSARINSLQDDIQRISKERDDAAAAHNASEATHEAQLSELGELVRKAMTERDQALAAVAARDAAISERDSEILALHEQVMANENARNDAGKPHPAPEGG